MAEQRGSGEQPWVIPNTEVEGADRIECEKSIYDILFGQESRFPDSVQPVDRRQTAWRNGRVERSLHEAVITDEEGQVARGHHSLPQHRGPEQRARCRQCCPSTLC